MSLENRISFHGHGQPEPIGLEYIAASLQRSGFQCDFVSRYELEVSATNVPEKISMLSCLSSEWNMIVSLAQEAKSRGNITILGGYHASGYYNTVKDSPVIDYVVVGEGEEVGVELAAYLLKNIPPQMPEIKKALSEETKVIHAPRIQDINKLPHPVRYMEYLGEYNVYDLMWPPRPKQVSTSIVLASRGCRFKCDFCASATVWGSGISLRDVNDVVSELVILKNRFNTNTVVFIDQSLGQDPEWTIELCNAIKTSKLDINWYHQSNLTIERHVIDAMAEAGCKKIGFGLEGLSEKAMRLIKPNNPKRIETANNVFSYCMSKGIFVKAYLLIGFPWETEEDFEEYIYQIKKIRASEIKISFLTPFPGTSDWDKYSSQLLTQDFDVFDTTSMPVVKNENISVERYFELRTKLFQVFYDSETYYETVTNSIKLIPEYRESFREFIPYLKKYDMISDNFRWLELIKEPSHVMK